MKWTDSLEIALALIESRPHVNPERLNFVDLMHYVIQLPGFSDDPERCGERVLEAIQQAWINELH
ncbi:MAG: hypothetical protein RIR70_644 [Pseudomonadota bacterium]|jgi:FeS assembly protein IscX